MGIKAVSEMTQDELNAFRGKKSFVKPLFKIDNSKTVVKKETAEEKPKRERRRKKEAEDVEHVEEKPKRERKRKKDKSVEKVEEKPKRERKSKNKEVSSKEFVAKPEKGNKSADQMNKEMEAALLQHKSKKQIREEKRRKKQEEAELYPNETKKEPRLRLKREKFEKEATEKLEKELRQSPKTHKSNNGKLVFTTLYDNEAHDRLIQIYSQVTAKRTKAEQELDKIKKGCRNKTGLLIALHGDNAGGERFSMMGKLVEKGFVSHRCYSTGYHFYEILE